MSNEPPSGSRSYKLRRKMQAKAPAILRFLRHYSKELIIAFILAIAAAILADPYLERHMEKSADEILKNNRAAVAVVTAYNQKGEPFAIGSGLFIATDGTLITNYHVIEGAARIEAKLPSGAFYKMKWVRGAVKDIDTAILQFDAQDTPAVKALGDSDQISFGQKVVSIGSPLGLPGIVSQGNISNPKLKLDHRELIQFTAPISPGSSGGGLFDTQGRVIGLTTASLDIQEGEQAGRAQNLNLAVPINLIKYALVGHDKRLTEESPALYYSLGNLAEDRGDYETAKANFEKAIALDDKNADAYLGLGGTYYELGEYELEVKNYLKAAQADPKNSDAYYYLATAYEDTGDYSSAINAYQKALQVKPDKKEALHDLCLLYLALGEKAKASALLPKLMPLDPGSGKKLKLLLEKQR